MYLSCAIPKAQVTPDSKGEVNGIIGNTLQSVKKVRRFDLPATLLSGAAATDSILFIIGALGPKRHDVHVSMGRTMDTRYIFSVLVGLFAAASIFAAVTVVRHVSGQPTSPNMVRAG
jgi:hypothetical protein